MFGLVFLIPVVAIISGTAFVAVVGFAIQRRREREAYYRYEFRKRLVDAGKMDGDQLLRLMEREERALTRRRHEGLMLGGFICVASGLGTIAGLWQLTEPAVALVGLIPLALGVAFLLYAVFFAPKEEEVGNTS